MDNRFLDQAGIYAADVQVAYARNGALGWLVAAGWLCSAVRGADGVSSERCGEGCWPFCRVCQSRSSSQRNS